MSIKSILEPESQVPIYDECDVLVVGGGSAGHSAAIAAARAGCKNVILMERYGYCGGDVTGGYVLLVPALSFYGKTYVQGIQEEWFTRLEKIPRAVAGPPMELAGSKDPEIIKKFAGVGGATAGVPATASAAVSSSGATGILPSPTRVKRSIASVRARLRASFGTISNRFSRSNAA